MNTKQAMARLEELGDEKRRAFNAKRGAGDNQFGVKTADIRKLAKEIKGDHELGLSLWETGNADAQMLAILLVRAKDLDAKQLGTMAKEGTCEWVADWLNSYVIKKHPDKESVRERWMKSTRMIESRVTMPERAIMPIMPVAVKKIGSEYWPT
jgi:3-methyladenine DNA glycosylase AlkD